MSSIGQIYVGNLKTDVSVLVNLTNALGNNNSIVDLSLTNSQTITLTDPDLHEITYTSSAKNPPGTDGITYFVTDGTTSIWIKGGLWKARATVIFTADGSKASTEDIDFEVLP